MPYNLSITENPDYLKVEISGEWIPGTELDDSIDAWSGVAHMAAEKKKKRILVIMNVPGYLPTADAFNLVESAEKFGWQKDYKLAVVHLHSEKYRDYLVAETLGTESGYNVKMFDNEDKAEAWLLGS